MNYKKTNASEVIDRLSSAYGVSTQRALAEALDVPSNNVSAWLQRSSVPGSAIIKCALDTNADLKWLVTGELENAKCNKEKLSLTGKALYEKIMSNGGKAVLQRILNAYGFTMQKQLCELLDISSGTVSTWIRRNYFPGDVVVACALDTGVSLAWLAAGEKDTSNECSQAPDEVKGILKIKKMKLIAGKLTDSGFCYFDQSLISSEIITPLYIESASKSWLADFGRTDLSNGRWVIDIDGNCDIYDIARIPGSKINIVGKATSFECSVDDITPMGVVVQTFENNI